MDIDTLRRDTPGCRHRCHFNNAGAALMPGPVLATLRAHVDLEAEIGGYEAEAARRAGIEQAYDAIAALAGATRRQVAFTENATAAFAQALSAIPFAAGDTIVTTRHDYTSSQIQYLSLAKRFGIEVVHVPDAPEGGVDLGAMAAAIASRHPRLVAVSHVPTSSGLVQDVEAIGRLCRQAGAWYLVDACQSVGQMPVDAGAIGCDFLSATARKFLRGPRGCGFLVVSNRALDAGLEPLFLDLQGAEWTGASTYRAAPGAARFENWEFAWALVLATGEAARYAARLGLEAIRERAWALAARLRAALAGIPGVRVLDRGARLGAIVTAWVDGWEPPALVAALRQRRINTSAQLRSYNVFDFDAKGVAGALRLSPHYYNTGDEVDEVVGALGELARRGPAANGRR